MAKRNVEKKLCHANPNMVPTTKSWPEEIFQRIFSQFPVVFFFVWQGTVMSIFLYRFTLFLLDVLSCCVCLHTFCSTELLLTLVCMNSDLIYRVAPFFTPLFHFICSFFPGLCLSQSLVYALHSFDDVVSFICQTLDVVIFKWFALLVRCQLISFFYKLNFFVVHDRISQQALSLFVFIREAFMSFVELWRLSR